MHFQSEPGVIRWKLHLRASPAEVYRMLATDAGRAQFWAESAIERDDCIEFEILNYPRYPARIVSRQPGRQFALEYFGSDVEFTLHDDGRGGTDLHLLASRVGEDYRMEMVAGWVSVLMALKAAVDFGVDLRNHDATRAWEGGYVDN